jgi:4-amino-4-deoxy-L-arabinose transferase-like glycosyltransferase
VTRRQRQVLSGVVLVGFALRLGWALYARPDAPIDWYLSGDQFSYFHYGNEIARGRGYNSYITGEATAYYPIGFPAILGALYFVVLHTPIPDNPLFATALFHVVLGTASVALVFVVGRAVASIRVGLVAATVLAVFPNVIYQVATLQLETTFIFLLLVALAVITTHDWATGAPTISRLLAFGATLGVAVLVRPFAAVLLVGLAGALAAVRIGWRRVALLVAVPAAVVVALSIPWTIRNAVRLDAFVPSSTNMGDTLCLDRNLDAEGGFRFADHDGCAPPDLHEVPRNRESTKKAIRFVLDHPDRELLQIVRRARFMFQDDHDGIIAVQTLGGGPFLSEDVVETAEAVADWYYYAVLVLAVAGLAGFAHRDHRPGRLVAASGLVGLLVIPLLLWGNPRFHLPLLPFMALSAAFALDWLWRRRREPEPEPETP